MATWAEFAEQAPDLARFGLERLGKNRVAYLATVRADGGPRVHPVVPFVGAGKLLLFMEPASPKGKDLQRDGRYALHCTVEDAGGGAGEFSLRGRATLNIDSALRAEAERACPYTPQAEYILYVLEVDAALANVYDGGTPKATRWKDEQAGS